MTRGRFALLGLLTGLLVGLRAWRRHSDAGPAADHDDLLAVERGVRRTEQRLDRRLAAAEQRSRRRSALTVALAAVAALPAVALAARPDADPLAAALVVGAYALLATGALLVATRTRGTR